MASMELYSEGSRVWLPDESHVWVSGEVLSSCHGDETRIEVESCDGRRMIISLQDGAPPLRNPDILIGANDLTSLSHLHEPAVLHNLKVRFQQSGTIYTYCGIVLVAINPYQSLPIYGSEIAAAYSGRHMGDLDPHIFAIAEEAYARLSRESCSQSIIVSGESGAGKTVSAKYTMSYFAAVGGAESCDSHVERKVLASNPIMEAIGNARTTRNDNSSRFGKYIQINFNPRHQMTGAHMSTYLLEKSRCVCPSDGERNYHIFYQLCACWENKEFEELGLAPATEFNYTNQGGCVQINGVNDQSEFSNTREAMQLLGFHSDHEAHLFRILASILHLGNIQVGVARSGGEDIAAISLDDGHLTLAAQLLGVAKVQLRLWLSHRLIVTARESFKKPLSPSQAINARDGLSKHLYAHLFDWVVKQINQSLSSRQSHDKAFIGVLDIYGFEVFNVNSFEQFCINYANEKLQQQFNQHVFKLEQQEYIKEAIEWSFIDFHDNQPAIDLIENRLGILDLLDETCRMPSSSDSLFIQKLYSSHQNKTQSFSKPRTSTNSFCVHHYAGVVEYLNTGFVEKNLDSVFTEHISLVRSSKHKLVAQLFDDRSVAKTTVKNAINKKGGTKYKETIGSQFRSSLSQLMSTLSSTTPHYVRCIKPNDSKTPFTFDPHRVVQQLRACGVLETVRISAAGYPSRWLYQDFHQRYRMLVPRGQSRRGEHKLMVCYILQDCIKDNDKYCLGKTKVFFRAGQVAYLEKLRSQRLHISGVLIQKHIRGWLQRRHYVRLRDVVLRLQAVARGMVARRWAWQLRQTRAAIILQKNVRCFVARSKFLQLRHCCLAIQTYYRGWTARKTYASLLHNKKATLIQTTVRGWLTRLTYRRTLKRVILVQCCVRRWSAKRQLRALKIDARSVNKLKGLNKGLEIKIIELQQKLTEQINQNNFLNVKNNRLEAQIKSDHLHHTSLLDQAKLQLTLLQSELESERSAHTTLEEQLNAEKAEHKKTLTALATLEEEMANKVTDHMTQSHDMPESHMTESHEGHVTQVSVADISKDSLEKESPKNKNVRKTPSKDQSISCLTPVKHSFVLSDPKSLHFSPPPTSKPHPQAPPTSTPLPKSPKKVLEWNNRNGTLLGTKGKIRSMLAELKNPPESQSSKVKYTPDNQQKPYRGYSEGKSLPDEALIGLRHAFDLINSLSSLNVGLQDELNRVTRENMMLQDTLMKVPSLSVSTQRKPSVPLTPLSPNRHGNSSQPSPRRMPTPLRSRPSQINISLDSLAEAPSMGMLEWDYRNVGEVVEKLVMEMNPEKLTNQIPCLPAHMIFMCLRYVDHVNIEEQAISFMEGVVNSLHKVTHRNHDNLELLSFWMANTCRLMHNIKQFSGQQISETSSQCGLVNFDLSEYHHILTHRAMAIYHQMVELVHNKLKNIIVPGLVEHEAIPGIQSSRPIGSKAFFGSCDMPDVTVEMVVKEIDTMVDTLQRNFVDPIIVNQIIKQIFFVVNATMLNNLLLRRELCHWSKGVQMRYNLSQLEDWCRDQSPSLSAALNELLPIIEASKLLQMRKSSNSDVQAISDHCTHLNALQVQKVLSMYTPADEYEERVPSSVIRLVAERCGADQVDPNNIMVDVHRFYPIEISYVSADVSFSSLRISDKLLGKILTII